MVNCELVRSSILAYLQEETEILATSRACIVSLPIKLFDGVNVEVFVEEMLGGFMVHDGGRALGNLESSGLVITETKLELLSQLAARLGVSFDKGVFRAIAKANSIQDAVFSIGQCCSVSMFELLKHSPSTEEEQIKSRVSADINDWGRTRGIEIQANRKVQGQVKQYTIDFVAETKIPIAISVLVPSYGASVSADRYGLQVLDLGNVPYKRLAVLAKPKLWKRPSRAIIQKLADGIAEFDEDAGLFPNDIAVHLDILAA